MDHPNTINKETQVLNDTLDEMDLIDIFWTFHPNAEENTFSSAHGYSPGIDHILGDKSNISKFKKIAIERNTFEPVLMRWMNLEHIIYSEISQKEKDKYRILTHIYVI